MPMTGWGVADVEIEDCDEHLQVTLHDLMPAPELEYVVVPHDVLPVPFAMAAAALAHHYAGSLGIAVPPVHFFAERSPELPTPWLERIAPEQRAAHLFRRRGVRGFATEDGHVYINVAEAGAELVDTVAHEVAHVAGFDEREARAFGQRARNDFRGG
jgi:hypothetical protein